MVRDLDTGIVYGPDWLWDGSFDEDRVSYSAELAGDIRQGETTRERVLACRVVSCRGNANNHRITTMLTLEDQAPRGSA